MVINYGMRYQENPPPVSLNESMVGVGSTVERRSIILRLGSLVAVPNHGNSSVSSSSTTSCAEAMLLSVRRRSLPSVGRDDF